MKIIYISFKLANQKMRFFFLKASSIVSQYILDLCSAVMLVTVYIFSEETADAKYSIPFCYTYYIGSNTDFYSLVSVDFLFFCNEGGDILVIKRRQMYTLMYVYSY